MTGEPSPPPPPPAAPSPPTQPGPAASRREWHEWRRQQREYQRSQWSGGGWYGPWPRAWGGGWGWFGGAALVVIGLYYLLANLGLLEWVRGDILWPVLVILLGIGLLVRRARS